ncbi:hypothetical protein [Symbiobacterium thermophilum]|uniref:hypothetical protein n=1 Tax=Symbiobacterium thermophilum TaxID=2734 RepID=UPI0023524340|nr:hypothetical protein [Symbiobacterium thermophilum]
MVQHTHPAVIAMNPEELSATCQYIISELGRIETVAGTLAMIEREHYDALNRFDDRALLDLATEEQSAARQLSMVKHVCGELARRMADIQSALERRPEGGEDRAPAH